MTNSFPAPAAAAKPHVEREADESANGSSLVASVGHMLRRCYERACSAIFDSDDNCMRL